MKTIASEVSAFIKTKPFLSAALSQDIINLTSLARQIQPEIEKSLDLKFEYHAARRGLGFAGFAREVGERGRGGVDEGLGLVQQGLDRGNVTRRTHSRFDAG